MARYCPIMTNRSSSFARTLAGTTAAVVGAAAVGSAVTDPGSDWYRRLDKPSWQPPGAAFPIVWTSLYAGIAGASARVLTRLGSSGRQEEASAFRRALALNLALNAGWSVVFFGRHHQRAAVGVAVALAASSIDLTRRASAAGTGPALTLAPYAAWTTFAAGLTADIARRNAPSR